MRLSLVSQIALGIAAGVLLVIISPEAAGSVALLGQLFVSALKAVVQDSTETALNSSTDMLFTAAACHRAEARQE